MADLDDVLAVLEQIERDYQAVADRDPDQRAITDHIDRLWLATTDRNAGFVDDVSLHRARAWFRNGAGEVIRDLQGLPEDVATLVMTHLTRGRRDG